jgi:hypothetical protein
MSPCLLIGAGMQTHSLVALEDQNVGFDAITFCRPAPTRSYAYQPSGYASLYAEISDHTTALPGVQSATLARFSPVSGYSSSHNFSIQGYQPQAGKQMEVWDLSIAPHFFETLKIPVLLGRSISQGGSPDPDKYIPVPDQPRLECDVENGNLIRVALSSRRLRVLHAVPNSMPRIHASLAHASGSRQRGHC